MIKPINISPIETTNKIYFKCSNCGLESTVVFTNRVINTDNENDLEELKNEPCPKCKKPLGEDKEI